MSRPPGRPFWVRAWRAVVLGVLLATPTQAQTRPATQPATAPALNPADAARVEKLTQDIRAARGRGALAEALESAREVLSLRTRGLGAEHWQTRDADRLVATLALIQGLSAEAQQELAEADRHEERAAELHRDGRYDDAAALAEQILSTRQRWLPADHVDTARALFNLGNTLLAREQPDQAQARFLEASQMFLRIYGGAHPNLAAALSRLATTLIQSGDLETGLRFHQSALKMRRELDPGDNPDVALSLGDVGDALSSQRKPADALPFYQEQVEMLRRLRPGDDALVATRIDRLGDCLFALFRAADALPLYEEALAMRRRLFVGDHTELATSLHNMGVCLHALYRYDDALQFHEEAAAMRRRLAGGDHADVARSLDNAGYCLSQLGRWDESLARHEEALAMQRRLHPGDHPDVVASLNSTSMWLSLRGRAAEALSYRQEALEMRRRLDPAETVSLAIDYDGVGYALASLGRRDEALKYHQDALAIYRRVADGDDPTVAISLNTVAECLNSLARPADAVEYYQQSLAMFRRLEKTSDGAYTAALRGLGNALIALGRSDEALPLYQEALGAFDRVFGHPATLPANPSEEQQKNDALVASSLQMISANLFNLGRAADALNYAEKALALRKRLYPGDHPDVATSLSMLAAVLQGLGRPAEALRYAYDAQAMRQRIFTTDHTDLIASNYQIGGFLIGLGRAEEALGYYEQALAMAQRLFSGDHAQLAVARNNMGLALGALGRFEEALQHFQDSLAMSRRMWEGDDWSAALLLNNIGYCQTALGRTDDALAEYQDALAMYRRLFDADYPAMAQTLNNVGAALFTLGRKDEALPYCEDAVAMSRRQKYPQFHFWAANLARVYLELGRVDEAIELLKEAISQIESLRESARRLDEQERATYFALLKQFGAFETMVRAQIRRGDGDEALRYLEKGRARSLLDLLERSRFDPLEQVARRAAAQQDDALRQRIAQVRLALSQAEQEVNRVEYELALTRTRVATTPEAQQQKQADLERLITEQRAARAAQRNAGRQWFDIVGENVEISPARDPAEIRRALDQDQRLLIYSITAADAVLLVVPPPGEEIAGYTLAWPDGTPVHYANLHATVDEYLRALLRDGYATQRADVETQLETLNAVPTPTPEQARAAGDLEAARQRLDRASLDTGSAATATGDAAALGEKLFRTLVPADLWHTIKSAPLIYLVPDGPLHRIPFETLVVHPASTAAERRYWLDEGPPLVYGPSASALLWSRKRREEQLTGRPDHELPFEAVTLGDPIFARDAAASDALPMPDTGVLVLDVPADSAGAAAGLARGDVVLTYDGQTVTDDLELQDRTTELERAVRRGHRPREPVPVTIWRAGQQRELSLSPGRWGVEFATSPPPQATAALRGGTFDAKTMAVERGDMTTRFGGLEPLPGTRREVLSIFRTLTGADYTAPGERSRGAAETPTRPSPGGVKVLLGEAATETELYAVAPLGRFLHLATHQLADETEFASYSALALTLPSVVTPIDSGFLKLVDLFEHWRDRLSRCELVVLSACETQRGRMQRDEGVFALPWGFMYAGAPSLVASLWRVNDASTAELMSSFYKRLSEQPASKLAAFTDARRRLRERFPEPYFWAPFIYMGDPR